MPEHEHRRSSKGGIHKKLGPLEMWQWVAIGAALGVMYYIYKLRQNAANQAAAQTPASAAYNASPGPIDPTTGIPYSQEGGGAGGAGTGTAPTLAQELADLGQIQGLQAGMTPQSTLEGELADLASIESLMTGIQLPNGGATPGAGHASLPKGLASELKRLQHEIQQLQRRRPRKDGKGHTVHTHPGGRKTANSSAHNAGRRGPKPVAPPNHQRANQQHHSTPAMVAAEQHAQAQHRREEQQAAARARAERALRERDRRRRRRRRA